MITQALEDPVTDISIFNELQQKFDHSIHKQLRRNHELLINTLKQFRDLKVWGCQSYISPHP